MTEKQYHPAEELLMGYVVTLFQLWRLRCWMMWDVNEW